MTESLNVQAWSEADLQQLRKLRAEGKSYEEIGILVRRSKGAVARKAKDLGLVEPPRGYGSRVPPPIKPPPLKRGPKPLPDKPRQAQPLRPGAVTLPILPSLHEPLRAYIGVSPMGHAVPSTIQQTPDDAWRALRDQLSEPDTLIDKGWHICRVLVILEKRVELVEDPEPVEAE